MSPQSSRFGTGCVLACAVHRLRVLHLLIQSVVLSSVAAFVVAVAISPGTPRYRRTRHTERVQGKALYIVRTPTHPPTAKQQPNAAPTREGPTHRRGTWHGVAAMQALKLWMGANVLVSFTGPKSPLFAMARAAGAPRTPPHPHARAGTRIWAR